MKTWLERRWCGGPNNPSIAALQVALAELSTSDLEHPDAWLTDEREFTVSVFESDLVIFADAERELCRGQGVSRENALELWLLLQQGQHETIQVRLSA